MIARLAWIVVATVFSTFSVASANENLFGLGVSRGPEPPAIVSTFGLGPTTTGTTLTSSPVVVQIREGATALLPPVAHSQVVRRASSSWVDQSVGSWNTAKLSAHLRGELASPQHRGQVPAGQLDGRSLNELKAIHDNIHEGYAWNGGVTQSRVVTVQPKRVSSGNCPGGVCPAPTRFTPRRLFRR